MLVLISLLYLMKSNQILDKLFYGYQQIKSKVCLIRQKLKDNLAQH